MPWKTTSLTHSLSNSLIFWQIFPNAHSATQGRRNVKKLGGYTLMMWWDNHGPLLWTEVHSGHSALAILLLYSGAITSFPSGRITIAAVVNPPNRNLVNRTTVYCANSTTSANFRSLLFVHRPTNLSLWVFKKKCSFEDFHNFPQRQLSRTVFHALYHKIVVLNFHFHLLMMDEKFKIFIDCNFWCELWC